MPVGRWLPWIPGSCASSRLDQGLKVSLFQQKDQNLKMTKLTFSMRTNGQKRHIPRDPVIIEKLKKKTMTYHLFRCPVDSARPGGATEVGTVDSARGGLTPLPF